MSIPSPRNPREYQYREDTHKGFDFFNDIAGRPLTDDEPVIAIADAEVLRINYDFSAPTPESIAF